jgi:hypothetical protein
MTYRCIFNPPVSVTLIKQKSVKLDDGYTLGVNIYKGDANGNHFLTLLADDDWYAESWAVKTSIIEAESVFEAIVDGISKAELLKRYFVKVSKIKQREK